MPSHQSGVSQQQTSDGQQTMNRSSRAAVRGLVAAALVAAGAMAAVAQEPAADARPKAVVPQPVHEAGTVPMGEKIVHDFVIENQGSGVLEITEVRPACGCTVAQFDRTIAPGASGKVHAVLDTATFAGPISKGITVLTSDSAQPRLELTVKATVQPHVMADPGYARFIQAQHSDPGVIEQRVWTASFDGLEILDITSPYPFLTVKHEPLTDEDAKNPQGKGKQHHLNFVLDYAEAPIGTLAEYVVVKTNHPQQPELKIPVSGFIRPLVVLTPEKAEFGSIALDEDGAFGSIYLKHYGNVPLEISAAETTVEGIEIDVEAIEAGKEFKVRVQLPPDMPKGPFAGTIRLSTNNPRQPTVEIPVSGTVS
jgi:hypothetical protein